MRRVLLIKECRSWCFFLLGVLATIAAPAQTDSPQIIYLKNCPPPVQIKVPSQSTVITNTKDNKTSTLRLQPPSVTIPQPATAHFTNFNTEQGLALSSVSCSMVDHLGNIWFGTPGGGVSRFDGKVFTNFTAEHGLAHNVVWCIMEDKNNNIWIGTQEGGVSKYDGKSFTNYTIKDGLALNNVSCITQDTDGNMWFGTLGGGVSEFDGKTFTNYSTNSGLAHNSLWRIFQDKKGNMWFGTDGKGLCKFDGTEFTTYTTNHGLLDNTIYSLASDKAGNLWIGTAYGVSVFDGETFNTFSDSSVALKTEIVEIMFDKHQNIWFATEGNGVLELKGKQLVTFSKETGLVNNITSSVVEDKSGNIWIGTGNGVSMFNGSLVSSFNIFPTQSSINVWSITQDLQGNLWFGSANNGLYKYDGKTVTNYSTAQGLAANIVWAIKCARDGKIWAATEGGLSCFDGYTFTNYGMKQGLFSNNIWKINEDKKGNIWIGTGGGGLSCFDGEAVTTFFKENGLTYNSVTAICEDKNGNMWIGTPGFGICKYDGKKFTKYTTDDGLCGNDIYNIIEDRKGNIWISTTGNGVSRFDGKSFLTLNANDGLASNQVYTMLEYVQSEYTTAQSSNNFMMFGTNLGYSVFEGWKTKDAKFVSYDTKFVDSEMIDFRPVWTYYNNKTGYPIKDLNSSSTCVLTKNLPKGEESNIGTVWAACGDYQIIRFDPEEIKKETTTTKVYLQHIKLNNEAISWYDLLNIEDTMLLKQQEMITYGKTLKEKERVLLKNKYQDVSFNEITPFYPIPQNLEMPHSLNTITIDYFTIETGKNFLVRYQYILEGHDTDWSPVTDKTYAQYGNLFEGSYTFKVKACNSDGVWGEPASFTFTVLAPWWRTWYMYTLYAIAGIIQTIVIVRWNGKRLRERAKELSLEVQKATATIVEQKKMVEEKNKEITDSINYARTIQRAILPTTKQRLAIVENSFVLFKPKDIVSGDFYWFTEKADKHIVAACDCTGHGVPGALMSMIGSNILNEIVNEKGIINPNEILNAVSKKIRKTLKQNEHSSESKDGMDVALIAFDSMRSGDYYQINYSGAQRPLWIVEQIETSKLTEISAEYRIIKNEKYQLTEIKATKASIGGSHYFDAVQFVNHTIDVSKNATIYMFSDGYADQFGKDDKKLMTSRFKEVLLSIQHLSMAEQEAYLDSFINDWMKGREQIDDILVIGMRL